MASPVKTEWTSVAASDGASFDTYLALPPAGKGPGLVLFQEIFGVNEHIRMVAEQYALDGFVVSAPDVFWRQQRRVDLGYEGADRQRGIDLMGQTKPAELEADIVASVKALRARPEITGKVGAVGYCMGGRLAFGAAAVAGERAAAVASFHASRMVTDDETSPHLLLPRIRGEVYVAHADHDGGMPPEQQERFAAALREAGLTFSAEQYDDARHGFTMSDTPVYDADATERHWKALLDLFDRQLH